MGAPEVHAAANLLPMMGDVEFAGLVEDIRQNGQREPIVYWCGQLIDGRNRLKACRQLEIEPLATELPADVDPVAVVLSANVHRRHLSESQRAMVAARLAIHFEPAALERKKRKSGVDTPNSGAQPDKHAGESSAHAAAIMQVGRSSVDAAKVVVKRGSRALQQAVDEGRIAVSRAAAVARDVPKREQLSAATRPGERSGRSALDQLTTWWDRATPAEQQKFIRSIDRLPEYRELRRRRR